MSNLQLNPNGLTFSQLVAHQRTEKGLAFDRMSARLRSILEGNGSRSEIEKAKALNREFCERYPSLVDVSQKAVVPTTVHVPALMSNFSKQYTNDEYIGERIMPAFPVAKRSDKYYTYNKRDRFAVPNDVIGTDGKANEVVQGRGEDNYSVIDYGLQNYLDLEVIQNQDAAVNEMLDTVEAVLEGIALSRELRIAAIAGVAGSYGTNTAAAATAWNDAAGGSLIADMLAADAALWNGPNPTMKVGFCSLNVWNSGIANNPALKGLHINTEMGMVTPDRIKAHFGLDEMLIGRARKDTANEGQTASYSRIWPDVFGIVRVARRPGLRSLHFGSTFRMNSDPYNTEWFDPSRGKRGSVNTKVTVSEDHKVVSTDAGFLITGVLA